MDENLEFYGKGFKYFIKTYHCYNGEFEVEKNVITVTIWNVYKGKVIKEEKFTSKMLKPMTNDQKREYILDCLYIFDKRIREFNEGKKLLG